MLALPCLLQALLSTQVQERGITLTEWARRELACVGLRAALQVLERGITLTEWARRERDFFDVSLMVERLARLLDTLHSAGLVHRDLKGDNVLYLLHSTTWRLLDLGIAAQIGTHVASTAVSKRDYCTAP
jgi:serine/threonine protein kinase